MPKTGVLLINTGTPDAPTVESIRAYYEEFMHDRMLFSCPKPIWEVILRRRILPTRPQQKLADYQKLYRQGSPLLLRISRTQLGMVGEALASKGFAQGDFACALAMRYGNPSIASGLCELRDAGCERLVVVPLYPQEVKVCAGTCLAETDRCLDDLAAQGWRPQQVVRVRSFYRQPAYLDAVAGAVRSAWKYSPGARLLFSWHSTLMKDIRHGDPYQRQNDETARAVATRLGLPDDAWQITYQSRFDGRKWLQPSTAATVLELARAGVKDVCIVMPGFVADNLETVVEVGEQLRARYLEVAPAGSSFTVVPALNESPLLAEAVAQAIIEGCEAEAGTAATGGER